MAFAIEVKRRHIHSESIIGRMSVNGSELCYTLELPWKNNQKNVSCIPPGTYSAFVRTDGTRGWRLELKSVPSRGNIQIHVGNKPSDIQGCILVGTGYNTNWVSSSKVARDQLKKLYEDAGSPSDIGVTVIAPPATESSFTISVERLYRHSQSIIGKMYVNGEELCYTLELPWKDNQKNVSCIPQGSYTGFIRTDGTRGWRIELRAVPNRGNVQIHVGNYPSDIRGCILVGMSYAANMVTNSKTARDKLKKLYEDAGAPHEIVIKIAAPLPAYFSEGVLV